MKTTVFESGYPCYPYDSKDNSVVHKTVKIGDSAQTMPTKKITAPPPIPIENYLSKRTQKDSVDIKLTAKVLTFDDMETMPKASPRTRQADSMTRVNTVVNTPVVYIPLSTDAPQRTIAPLPNDILEVMHPGAKLIECPEELKAGMKTLKHVPVGHDPNQVLECHTYR